jgi:hypothetical protein
LLLLLPCSFTIFGCGAEGWHPQPPSGVTYQYDYQGFREKKTHVIAGAMAAPGAAMAFGGGFSFRKDSEVHAGQDADPFAESSPIDGVRFNEHLGNQGAPLAPAASASSSNNVPVPVMSAVGGQI